MINITDPRNPAFKIPTVGNVGPTKVVGSARQKMAAMNFSTKPMIAASVSPAPDNERQHLKKGAQVSDEEMDSTLERISKQFSKAAGSPVKITRDLGNVSLQGLILMVTNALVGISEKNTELTLTRLKGNSDAYIENLRKQSQDFEKKYDEISKQQAKAKKAETVTKVMNWAVACVEMVSGMTKFVIGTTTLNPVLIIGGLTEYTAGTCGMIKNVLMETGYKSAADDWGKVQLGFEIASMVFDLISIAQVLKAGVTVAKVSSEAAVMGAEIKTGVEMIEYSGGRMVLTGEAPTRTLMPAAIEGAAREIGPATLRACAKEFSQVVRKLGPEAVNKIIAESGTEVVRTMLKNGKELIPEEVASQLTKRISSRFAKAAIRNFGKSPAMVIKGTTAGANKIHNGVLSYEMAGLERGISDTDSTMAMRQALMDTLTADKKAVTGMASDALNNLASALDRAMRLSAQNPQYQLNF